MFGYFCALELHRITREARKEAEQAAAIALRCRPKGTGPSFRGRHQGALPRARAAAEAVNIGRRCHIK